MPQTIYLVSFEMAILMKSREILHFAGLSTDQHFHIFGIKIPRSFIRILLGFSLLLCSLSQYYICHRNYAVGLETILMPITCMATYSIAMAIYICLIIKTNKIAALYDYLQQIVDKSEL